MHCAKDVMVGNEVTTFSAWCIQIPEDTTELPRGMGDFFDGVVTAIIEAKGIRA